MTTLKLLIYWQFRLQLNIIIFMEDFLAGLH